MKDTKPGWTAMNRRERKGSLALAVLCLALALAPAWWPEQDPGVPPDEAAFEAWLDSLRAGQPPLEVVRADTLFPFDPNTADSLTLLKLGMPPRTIRSLIAYRGAGATFRNAADLAKVFTMEQGLLDRLKPFIRIPDDRVVRRLPQLNPFPFDPNKITDKEMLKMGVPEKVASTWLNYREKGGRFRSSSSLKKVYGLNEDLYRQLKPFIRLDAVTPPGPGADLPEEEPGEDEHLTPIDINRAGLEEWQSLRGIGPVLAARIMRFRDAMGGFHSVAQVAETWGLPDSTFTSILPQLERQSAWRKWAVNRLPADSLAHHPYLGFREAGALEAYREQHGPFRNVADLRRVHSITDSLLRKLEPYLVFD